jgi:hypothetical protein
MIGLLTLRLQLQSFTTAHNRWLSQTRSIPYWTTSVFSCTVTDLALIHESVTSSPSVVPGYTPQLNTQRAYLTDVQQWTIPRLFASAGKSLPNRCLAMVIFVTLLLLLLSVAIALIKLLYSNDISCLVSSFVFMYIVLSVSLPVLSVQFAFGLLSKYVNE